MKKIIKLSSAGMLMSILCVAFATCNTNSGEVMSDEQLRIELAKLTDDVYYVAGSSSETWVFQDDGTAKSWLYLFISENLQDTVAVLNRVGREPGPLFDGIFEFPTEAMVSSAMLCGYYLFPEEYRYAYPVKINSHRPLKEDEFLPIICFGGIPSKIGSNKSIVVESLSKI
jgi:hypothetical protein